jgi:hypothetical protein
MAYAIYQAGHVADQRLGGTLVISVGLVFQQEG